LAKVNQLDLTSSFIDLGFEGFVEISQHDEDVIYHLPRFIIRFIQPGDQPSVKHIHLDLFTLLIARKAPASSERKRIPISLHLDRINNGHMLRDVTFVVPKHLVLEADYLVFSVDGEISIEISSDSVPESYNHRVIGRAAWPITALGNRSVDDPLARRPKVIHKQPADPDDPCAPERIR